MPLDYVREAEVRAHVMTSVVLILRNNQHQGSDMLYVKGALVMAESVCLSIGVPWTEVVNDICEMVAVPERELLMRTAFLDAPVGN